MSNPYPTTTLGIGAIFQTMRKMKERELQFRNLVEITQAEAEILEEEWHSHSFFYQLSHGDELRILTSIEHKVVLYMKMEEKFHNDYIRLKKMYDKEKKRIEEETGKKLVP